MKKLTKSRKTLPLLLVALLLLVLPLLVTSLSDGYTMLIICTILIYSISVSGLDILLGYSGQISLGHAAFYMIAAYTSGLLHNYFGFPLIVTMLCGVVLATAVGIVLAFPYSRLKFHFLTLATVAFGEIVYYFLCNSPGKFTGDFAGLQTATVPLPTYSQKYYLYLVLFAIMILLKYNLMHSKSGRALMAIRENTHAAERMGINVRKYKVMAFGLSAMYVGLGGVLYIHMVGYAHPDMALQKQSVLFLTMLLFGGSGTILGPIIGVAAIQILLESIRGLQSYQSLFYGILLLIVILALPGGLHGAFRDLLANIRAKKAKKQKSAAAEGGNGS